MAVTGGRSQYGRSASLTYFERTPWSCTSTIPHVLNYHAAVPAQLALLRSTPRPLTRFLYIPRKIGLPVSPSPPLPNNPRNLPEAYTAESTSTWKCRAVTYSCFLSSFVWEPESPEVLPTPLRQATVVPTSQHKSLGLMGSRTRGPTYSTR